MKRKSTARQIAKDRLREIMSGDKARVLQIFKKREYEFPIRDGVEYQVEMSAGYDFKKKELIRVEVTVDTGERWEKYECDFIDAADLKALEGKKSPTR